MSPRRLDSAFDKHDLEQFLGRLLGEEGGVFDTPSAEQRPPVRQISMDEP